MFDFLDEEFISAVAARVALPLMAVGAVATPWFLWDKAEDLLDGEKDITISISDEAYSQLEKGEGNPARLYEEFGKQVNDIVVQNGDCITLTIENQDGEILGEVHHTPKWDISQDPAELCP